MKTVRILVVGAILFAAETRAAMCPPTPQWQSSFGGSGIDWVNDVRQTPDGGYLVAGDSDSPADGNRTATGFGNYDFWVVRLDSQGQKLWERTYGGSSGDGGARISVTPDGGFLLTGGSMSGADGNKGTPSLGQGDFWVIRCDPNGKKLWERSYGGVNSEGISRVERTTDGGFVLGGFFAPDWQADSGPHFGAYDVWVLRIDASGNPLWDRKFGGSEIEYLGDIRQTKDGGFILAIDSLSPPSGNKTAPNHGASDIWVIRLDANGDKLWEQSFGGTYYDHPVSVLESNDGSILIGGNSFSEAGGSKTSPLFGLYDFWVLRLDAAGNKIWEQTYGGSGDDVLVNVLELPGNRLLLAGSSTSEDGDHLAPHYGETDYWLLATDSLGVWVWDATFGGSDDEFPSNIEPTTDGGFILGGTSYSPPDGNKTNDLFGALDYWILKLSSETICETDGDHDGVPDSIDRCLDTPVNAVVDAHGCAIVQLVPCDGPWRSHGHYVREVVRTVAKFRKAGLITHRQALVILKQAAKSDCGQKKPRRKH